MDTRRLEEMMHLHHGPAMGLLIYLESRIHLGVGILLTHRLPTAPAVPRQLPSKFYLIGVLFQ